MIKNEELRLGNYILADGKIGYVSTLFPSFCQVNDNSMDQYSLSDEDEIIPIPLTEAVLMAVGFARKVSRGVNIDCTAVESVSFVIEVYAVDITIRNLEWGWYGNFKKRSHPDHNFIEAGFVVPFFHKLQNLIYEIVGQELQINMDELKKAVG